MHASPNGPPWNHTSGLEMTQIRHRMIFPRNIVVWTLAPGMHSQRMLYGRFCVFFGWPPEVTDYPYF